MKYKKLIKNIEAKLPTYSVVLLMVGALVSTMILWLPISTVSADPADFDNYVVITIDHDQVNQTLTDFPVLVYNSSWITNLNSTSFSFFQSDNNTECSWELVNYNYTTGELEAWVNVSTVFSGTDTTFFLYYDSSNSTDGGENNPTDTWDNGYVGVWHLSETGSGTRADSSPLGITMNASTNLNADSGVAGIVGGCCQFDGDGVASEEDYLYATNPYDFDESTPFSWQLFVESNESLTGKYIFAMAGDDDDLSVPVTPQRTWMSDTGHSNDCLLYWMPGQADIDTTSWYYLSATFDTTYYLAYKNGTLNASDTWDLGNVEKMDVEDVSIGSHSADYAARCFEGRIDEVWISDVCRNSSWINTNYNNMKNQTTFVTFGGSAPAGDSNSEYGIITSYLDGGYVTWSGQADTTTFSNDSSPGDNVTIYTSVNVSENCTDIYIDLSEDTNLGGADQIDFDSVTGNCDMYLQVSTDNDWDPGDWVQFTDGNSYNISLNGTWGTLSNDANPFVIRNGDGNTTIICIFKLVLGAGIASGTYQTASYSEWEVVHKYVSNW